MGLKCLSITEGGGGGGVTTYFEVVVIYIYPLGVSVAERLVAGRWPSQANWSAVIYICLIYISHGLPVAL